MDSDSETYRCDISQAQHFVYRVSFSISHPINQLTSSIFSSHWTDETKHWFCCVFFLTAAADGFINSFLMTSFRAIHGLSAIVNVYKHTLYAFMMRVSTLYTGPICGDQVRHLGSNSGSAFSSWDVITSFKTHFTHAFNEINSLYVFDCFVCIFF